MRPRQCRENSTLVAFEPEFLFVKTLEPPAGDPKNRGDYSAIERKILIFGAIETRWSWRTI
jgi:hypothetical protein